MSFSFICNALRLQNWRIDNDGMLRITARVLAEGIFDYLPDESPKGARTIEGLVPHYIPKYEFTAESLKTLEGKPVIVGEHEWRTITNTNSDGQTVGSIAGTPYVNGKYVVADLLITDKKAIDAIKDKKLVEISAGYTSECEPKEGTFQGKEYTCVQHGIKYNHVLLLPVGAGRCGNDVRIVNKTPKENNMITVQKTIGNKTISYKFTNEDDAKEAERMNEDSSGFSAKELENAYNECSRLKNELEDMTTKYEENMKVLQEQSAKINELLSPEGQSQMVEEAKEQNEAEEAIVEEATDEEELTNEEAEAIETELGNCKTFADRRKVIVQKVLKVENEDFKTWTQDAIDGSFETLAYRAMKHIENKKKVQNAKKTVMGGNTGKVQNTAQSRFDRILRPMRLGNRKNSDEKE